MRRTSNNHKSADMVTDAQLTPAWRRVAGGLRAHLRNLSAIPDTLGQDLVEYALVVAAIAVALVASVRPITSELQRLFESVVSSFP